MEEQANNGGIEHILNNSKDADLIYVPMNPFVKETLDFGGAEMVAGVYNVAGTAASHLLTSNPLALSLSGPVIEKAGFFCWEAIKAVKKTDGQSYFKRLKGRLNSGIANLLTDIVVHDSAYTAMMCYGLSNNVASPEALSFFSFLAALPPAIFAKHYGSEIMHSLVKQYSRIDGFKWEKYYESRFIIGGAKDPRQIFEKISNSLNLGNYSKVSCNDQYYEHKIPAFSDRASIVRVRETGKRNLEIGYLLSKRRTPSRMSEFNYFFNMKEKGTKQLSESEEPRLRWPLKIKAKGKKIEFEREIMHDDEIRVDLDKVRSNGSDVYILEFKTWKDIDRLCDAMKLVLRGGYCVRTTTMPKSALFRG
jgi:adenylate cyclase class IV